MTPTQAAQAGPDGGETPGADIEHGKMEMGFSTLVLVAAAMGILLAYFSPVI